MDNAQIRTMLGLRVKSFRNEQGLTQEEFSSIIGLEQANLSKIENGKTFPDITTLCTIISKANIEPDYLVFLQIKNTILWIYFKSNNC